MPKSAAGSLVQMGVSLMGCGCLLILLSGVGVIVAIVVLAAAGAGNPPARRSGLLKNQPGIQVVRVLVDVAE